MFCGFQKTVKESYVASGVDTLMASGDLSGGDVLDDAVPRIASVPAFCMTPSASGKRRAPVSCNGFGIPIDEFPEKDAKERRGVGAADRIGV